MNLEHLCKQIIEKWDLLKDKKKTLKLLKYHFELLANKRKKLKLGFIVFEIKEYKIDEFPMPIQEDINIRYTRQDNTLEDELKFETRLNALKWKWDFSNIGAFIIIISLIITFLYMHTYAWYCDNLPEFAFRDNKYNILIKNSLEILFSQPFVSSNFLNFTKAPTTLLMEILLKLVINFDLLF